MQKLGTVSILILAVLGACIWAIIPPSESIRLGKDLRGGVSMVYTVRMPEGADREAVLTQVIEVLKNRVNPAGVLDITITPQGVDRIEVVMPLPSPEVRALQVAFAEAVDDVVARGQIRAIELEESLRLGQARARFGGDGELGELVDGLQTAYDRSRALRAQLGEILSERDPDPDAIDALERDIASIELTEERLRGEVLERNIDEGRLRRALGLSADGPVLRDERGRPRTDERGQPIQGPSPRDSELDAIIAEFQHLEARIRHAVATHDAYMARRTSLDDPEDLRRLLRGAGVLEFRIAVRNSNPEGVNPAQLREQLAQSGPQHTDSPVAGWFRINDLKQWYTTPDELAFLERDPVSFFGLSGRDLVAARYNDDIYLLLYTSPSKSITHDQGRRWAVNQVTREVDQLGRPAVGFELDPAGGRLMSMLTGPHVDQPMAIVLDGEVYSAPRLLGTIARRGQITGTFSDAELTYLIRVLAAGSLEARLSPDPISTSILGPSLGGDNLRRGLEACVVSLIAIGIYMVAYYFFAGVVANFSLLCVGIMVFGGMAFIQGTFTLPGLAGIALTIGMAVDCNVLIYERIREEMVNNKEDLRTAVRISFKRAFNTIIDGQLTNMIVCLVLVRVATTEVKGFAVTMIIGVLATLFSSLVIVRLIFTIYTEKLGFRSLPMLATAVPAIHRALEPKIDWMGKRYFFYTASAIVCTLGIVLMIGHGRGMLDTEFRGGVALTMTTRAASSGEAADPSSGRLLLSRSEVEAEVRALGTANPDDPVLSELRNASVLTVGYVTPEFESATFQIKVANPRGIGDEEDIAARVVRAVVANFTDRLDTIPELTFVGAGDDDHTRYTFPIERDRLGDVIGRVGYGDPVGAYRGGVAIVLDDISPPVTVEATTERIRRMRRQPDFTAYIDRDVRVVGLEAVGQESDTGAALYASVAVLVADRDIDATRVDLTFWDSALARTEWRLVSDAMRQASSLDQVSSFSSAVARTLSAQAVVAVVLSVLGISAYVWFRFSSLRYSLAALAATAHDVLIAVAALALSHHLANTPIGRVLLIEEFRIDLNVIAGILTLIGYSLNDSIVIMDRIRENRGKLPLASKSVINLSINQTFSRTVLTSTTTLLAVGILYFEGGTGIRPFAFVLLIGLLTGTYSSVAIAAPLVWSKDFARDPRPTGSGGAGVPAHEGGMLPPEDPVRTT